VNQEIDRDATERRADDVRRHLGDVLGALDRRGHDMMDVKVQIRQHVGILAAVAGTVAVALALGIVAGIRQLAWRPASRGRQRLYALQRAWRHPERIARSSPRGPALLEIGRKVFVSIATWAATSLIRYGARRLGAVPR